MTVQGQDLIADHGFSAEPVYLTDLDRCLPPEALSTEPRWRRWRPLDYQTDTLSGVMLMAGPETAAPEVTYPLGVDGWHAVSIGLYGSIKYPSELLVKLSGADTFSILHLKESERVGHGGHIRELFWRVADLTDRDLVLGQTISRVGPGDAPGSFRCGTAHVAYIKLVPLSEAEVVTSRRSDPTTRQLFAHHDQDDSVRDGSGTAESVRRQIEPYRETDFSRMYWESGMGDLMFYFTRIGAIPTFDDVDDFGLQSYRLERQSWRLLRDRGVDPFRVALDHCHDVGMEFHASYRVAGFYFPPPLDHFNHGPSFYKHHPGLLGTDRGGNLTPRISYAYPETRAFVISLLREQAGYDIDGVCLLYNRRPPLLEYEPPLVDGFKAEYGEDPSQLDETDPRWLSYRARTLTQFMREVRAAMNEEAERQGRRRIEVSAVVLGSEEENLFNAMDLKAWVDQGLVDTLIPYTSEPNLGSMAESWADVKDAEFFVALTRGTACRLSLNLMPRQMSPETYRRRAAALYEAGVESLFFWDCNVGSRSNYSDSWNAIRRLGHRDEIAEWRLAGEPSLAGVTMQLRRLGDWDFAYATPG